MVVVAIPVRHREQAQRRPGDSRVAEVIVEQNVQPELARQDSLAGVAVGGVVGGVHTLRRHRDGVQGQHRQRLLAGHVGDGVDLDVPRGRERPQEG